MTQRKILVFTALPYSNNTLHLGHFLEYIQADIWVRFQKMRGHEVHFLSADDTHGTPIMLRAQALGISPEELVNSISDLNQKDYAGFGIHYNHYGSTNSPTHNEVSIEIYNRLVANDLISKKTISQLFDPVKGMFLPDRYVKGTCPKCKAHDQYGDNCEVCSAIYTPADLIDPKSAISGSTPVLKDSEHYFFELPKLQQALQDWNQVLKPELVNKMNEWFKQGLLAWDISRDAPYFGFKIPDTEDKYFYVWLDAPIGYLSTFKSYCEKTGLNFEDYWGKNSQVEIYNHIGKDILYFHALFWPAMLHGAQLRKPTNLVVHGHLTVNGEKMSKSRGTFIKANTFLKHFDAQALRYYFASKLRPNVVDIDINFDDFINKANSDLLNKFVNLSSRSAKFINQYFDNKLANEVFDLDTYTQFNSSFNKISDWYEQYNFTKSMKEIMALADIANRFVDTNAPWVLAKDEAQHKAGSDLHLIVTQALLCFRSLAIMLTPVVPEISAKVAKLFQVDGFIWADLEKSLFGSTITEFKPLYQRLDNKNVKAMMAETAAEVKAEQEINSAARSHNESNSNNLETSSTSLKIEPIEPEITVNEFFKSDLRVAKVINCTAVEGSDKLLAFTLDLGESSYRNIFSGIKEMYPNFAELIGRNVIVIANLKPRKMRFGISQGMILSAEDPITKEFKLLACDPSSSPGSKIS